MFTACSFRLGSSDSVNSDEDDIVEEEPPISEIKPEVVTVLPSTDADDTDDVIATEESRPGDVDDVIVAMEPAPIGEKVTFRVGDDDASDAPIVLDQTKRAGNKRKRAANKARTKKSKKEGTSDLPHFYTNRALAEPQMFRNAH